MPMVNNLRSRTRRNKRNEEMLCNHKKVLYNDEETSKWHREPFIKSGYRQDYSTFRQCIQSLFYINNQSFNVWSHIAAFLYFLVRFSLAFNKSKYSTLDLFNLPLLSSAIGTLTVYFASASAHLFNPMSEKAYKTCYFIDYAGISLYTFTSSQALFFYTRPRNTGWMIFESPSLYLSIACCLSSIGTYLCCKTNVTNNMLSTFLRVTAFLAGWLNTTIPYMAGVTFCSCHADVSCSAFSACSSLSLGYYIGHLASMISLGLIYSSRLPERLFPGIFDLFGSSHQFMHVLAALGTEFAFKVVELHRKQAEESEASILATVAGVSFYNTLVLTMLMLLLNAGFAIWFGLASGGDTIDTTENNY